MEGHITSVGIELRGMFAAELAEAAHIPVAGARAALAVPAALAVVAAEAVEAEPQGARAVVAALARGEHWY